MRLEAGGALKGRLHLGAEDGICLPWFSSCGGSRVFRAGVVQFVLGVRRSLKNLEKVTERSNKILLLVNLF